MGAQLTGIAQTLRQCQDMHKVYILKYADYIHNQLSKIKTSPEPSGQTFGLEIELVGVNKDYTFRTFSDGQFSEQYAPEIMTTNVELVTEPLKHSSLQSMIEHIDTMKKGVEGPALQIGGHPHFNLGYAKQFLNPRQRYQQLMNVLKEYNTQFCVPQYNGTKYCSSGAEWEGIGTSFQFTVNTPIEDVPFFYNAAKKMAPIAMYASASSPFIDGVLSNVLSTRSIVIPSVTSGGRSRWRTLEPLTDRFRPLNNQEKEMYEKMSRFDPGVAKYFTESTREGWLLRTVGDELQDIQPPPTFWPSVKLQGHIINKEGIPIEVRTAEQLANTHDTVHYMLGMLSMIQQESINLRNNESYTSSGQLDDDNVKRINFSRNIYWDNKSVHPVEIIRKFVPGMANLEKYGYSITDIKSVQEWWKHRVNDAQHMKKTGLQIQPELINGDQVKPETLEKMLSRHLI